MSKNTRKKQSLELSTKKKKEEKPCQNKMSVRLNLALLSINLLFNLISSWTIQIEANLRAQGESRRCGHGSAGMVNFDNILRMIESRKPCSISSGNIEKKEKNQGRNHFIQWKMMKGLLTFSSVFLDRWCMIPSTLILPQRLHSRSPVPEKDQTWLSFLIFVSQVLEKNKNYKVWLGFLFQCFISSILKSGCFSLY